MLEISFLFGFGDKMFIHTPDDTAQGTDTTTQGDIDLIYGTHRLIFNWEQALSDTLDIKVTPSIGVDTAEFSLGVSFFTEAPK